MAISVISSKHFMESKQGQTGMEEEKQKCQKEEDQIEEEEEDDELFEINLDVVNNFPPPHYWESYVTATTNTLMANCLLPIADVSCAVPMVSKAGVGLPWPGLRRVVYVADHALNLGFSSLGAFGLLHKKM